MKRILWLVLFVLVLALPLFAQDQTAQDPAPASPSIKLVAVTLLVKDYEEAGKWYSENLGFEVRDNKNPNPALKSRPIVGLPLFSAMRPVAPGKWSGQIYNADDGGTYASSITLAGADTLRVEGCVGALCGGETWTRVGR